MKSSFFESGHPLHNLTSSPHYLVVENLGGLSRGRPFVWDLDSTSGTVIGIAKQYPAAKRILPELRWPDSPEQRRLIEQRFPLDSIQLSCGGVVDQHRPLSFDDHPDSLFANNQHLGDASLFGRTYTILWIANGDEREIADSMTADREWLAAEFEREREKMPPEFLRFTHGPSGFIRRWFDEWYLSRLCRLPGQPSVDVDQVYRIVAET